MLSSFGLQLISQWMHSTIIIRTLMVQIQVWIPSARGIETRTWSAPDVDKYNQCKK